MVSLQFRNGNMEKTVLPLRQAEIFKQQALAWANKFGVCILLDGNHHTSGFSWQLAVDAWSFVDANAGNAFAQLEQFLQAKKQTVFGFMAYELKNEIENLTSRHTDNIGLPHLFFFEPRYLIEVNGNSVTINRNYPEAFEIVESILQTPLPKAVTNAPDWEFRTEKEKYVHTIETIKERIAAGDFYEINYCIEAHATQAAVEPVMLFHKLNTAAKAPFACFVKYYSSYVLCASPERFLKKEGARVFSQPMKGTIAKSNIESENRALQLQLQQSEKERAENIMIVDLVRNDLAKSCKTGSVKVDELCGVYAFETINQMISTISGTAKNEVGITDVIKNAFPMGSMTGAPKIEVMQAIDAIEDFQRGIFSGTVGYITPTGDFDFNVVIRSIFYHAAKGYLSLRSGGAITYDSQAESEWNEVLLKMKAMREVFASGS